MKKYFKYIGIGLLAIIVIYLLLRFLKKNKYLSYLHELGMNIADNMNYSELKTSYIYLHDYARQYKEKASQILRTENPDLWNRAKEISIKYKIFNL